MTSYINGVQQVSITIPNGSISATATITAAVGTAFIILQGFTDTQAGTNPAITQPRVELTNSTTVTAFRNTSDTSTVTVNAVVVDATSSLVKSVQNGTIVFTSGQSTNTATISSVTVANSVVVHLGQTSATTSFSPSTIWTTVALTNATTVTATSSTSGGSPTTGFCVIEFQGAALNSNVQAVSDTASPSAATRTHTITSVGVNNTMLINGGQLTSGSTVTGGLQYGTLTNGTTITIGTQTAGFVSITYNCFVVEFVSGVLSQNAQRGTITLTAATSGTASITSAVTANTLANFLGNSSTGTTYAGDYGKITQTDATTITGTVNTAVTAVLSWEALTFTAGASETVTLDKWFQRQDNPVLRPRSVPPYQNLLPQLTTFPEVPLISKWEPYYPDRIDVRKPLVPTGTYTELTGIIVGERILLDKWKPNYPDKIDVRKPLNPSGYYVKSQFTTFTETIRLDKWKPVYPDKVYTYKPLVPEGISIWPLGIALKETINLDKWEPYFPDKIDRKPRPVDTGIWSGIIGLETITMDKWHPTYQDIVYKFKPLVPEGWNIEPTGYTAKETINPDKWWPKYPDKIDVKKPLVPEGKVVHPVGILTGENVNIDKWLSKYPDIIWKAKKPLDIPNSGVFFIERITPDKWWPTYPDMVRRAKAALDAPYIVQPFVIEVITLDKWFNQQQYVPKRLGLFLNLTTGLFEPVFVPVIVPSTSTQIFWAISDDAFGVLFS